MFGTGFAVILGEEEIEVFLPLSGAIEKSLFDRCRNVDGYGLAHRWFLLI
jgi:hypothetical protein